MTEKPADDVTMDNMDNDDDLMDSDFDFDMAAIEAAEKEAAEYAARSSQKNKPAMTAEEAAAIEATLPAGIKASDLFPDSESDDEYPSTAPAPGPAPAAQSS